METIKDGYMEQMEITTKGYVAIEKTIKSTKKTGYVYLPKEWGGKRVKIILIDPID